MRSVHSDRMGWGIEPRKEEFCGGRDARNRRRQHVRHRYARCRRSAGVEGHITSERNASEPERSHVRPQAAEPTGPHREGEEPKPMMHGHEKSDSVIVAVKPTNKAEQPAAEESAHGPTAAESVEPRAGTKGNAVQQSTCRAQNRMSVSQALERIRQVAKARKKERFTGLFHHISVDLLKAAFFCLKGDAAPGVDRLTWRDYEADLGRRLEDLHDRVHRGAYRALPSRRVYIPKPDGRQRPLAVAALEDKIVQRAVVTLLNAIYEEDFLGFSYGFRPGRGTHDALDALCVGIGRKKVSFVLDAPTSGRSSMRSVMTG